MSTQLSPHDREITTLVAPLVCASLALPWLDRIERRRVSPRHVRHGRAVTCSAVCCAACARGRLRRRRRCGRRVAPAAHHEQRASGGVFCCGDGGDVAAARLLRRVARILFDALWRVGLRRVGCPLTPKSGPARKRALAGNGFSGSRLDVARLSRRASSNPRWPRSAGFRGKTLRSAIRSRPR